MNPLNKKSSEAKGVQSPAKQPAGLQPRNGVAAPHVRRPPAPPVYRPQPVPQVLQRKEAHGRPGSIKAEAGGPLAPPVYRPQPLPRVLQRKAAGNGQQAGSNQSGRAPVAPAIYRPQPTPKVLQTKSALTAPSSSAIQRNLGMSGSAVQPKAAASRSGLPFKPTDSKQVGGNGQGPGRLGGKPGVGLQGGRRAVSNTGVVQRSVEVIGMGGGGMGGGGFPPNDPFKGFGKGHYVPYSYEVDQDSIDEYYANLDRLEESQKSKGGPKQSSKSGSPKSGSGSQSAVIAERLAARYPKANRKIIDYLANAKVVLMDKQYCAGVLRQLQGQMSRQNKSLDTALSQREKDEGFRPRQVVTDILSPEDFLGHLSKGEHIFDVGTPVEHGPHTHRMQWYILYHAYQDGRLGFPPWALYQLMSRPEYHDSQNRLRTAWDDIFDFDDGARAIIGMPNADRTEARNVAAYSSPEWTNPTLRSNQSPLGNGVMVQELRAIAEISSRLGGDGLLNPKAAIRLAIQMKLYSSGVQKSDYSLDIRFALFSMDDMGLGELIDLYNAVLEFLATQRQQMAQEYRSKKLSDNARAYLIRNFPG